jgi:hypothetical protein
MALYHKIQFQMVVEMGMPLALMGVVCFQKLYQTLVVVKVVYLTQVVGVMPCQQAILGMLYFLMPVPYAHVVVVVEGVVQFHGL